MQEILTSLITSISVTFIGCLITYYFSNKNWDKTERQNKGKDIIDGINQCQKLVIEYYTANERNHDLEIQIKIILEQIENKTDLFSKEYKVADDFWKLRALITLKKFESSDFTKQSIEGEFIININAEVYRQIQKYYRTK